MTPTSTRTLLLGGTLFILATVLLFRWLQGHSRLFLALGLGALCLSMVSLVLAGRWRRKSPDPLQARREQRLWRSGPLGRQWLKIRQRLR